LRIGIGRDQSPRRNLKDSPEKKGEKGKPRHTRETFRRRGGRRKLVESLDWGASEGEIKEGKEEET